MSIVRFAIVVMTSATLFACTFGGLNGGKDPDRCKRAGSGYAYCDGNTLVSVYLRCVDDQEVAETGRQACPNDFVCVMGSTIGCVPASSVSDSGSADAASSDGDTSDAGTDDAASDPDARSIDIRH